MIKISFSKDHTTMRLYLLEKAKQFLIWKKKLANNIIVYW